MVPKNQIKKFSRQFFPPNSEVDAGVDSTFYGDFAKEVCMSTPASITPFGGFFTPNSSLFFSILVKCRLNNSVLNF